MKSLNEYTDDMGYPLTARVDRESQREQLSPSEVFWRDLYGFLKEHGYLLRPRYHPEWTPSWKGKGATVSAAKAEDGQLPHDVRCCG